MGWMALLDENDNEIGVVGDEPWDIMGAAMDEIVKVYQDTVGRPPNKEEIEQIVWFVFNARPKNEGEKQ